MRIRVSQQTTYRYAPPAKSMIQTLRLTPRNHDGQFVVSWRIDVDVDSRLRQGEDAFGNTTHVLSVGGPIDQLVVSVEGVVQTQDHAGVVRGAVERFPESLYLRETDLTVATEAVQAFAQDAVAAEGDPLGRMHALMSAVHARLEHRPEAPGPGQAASAAEAIEAAGADGAGLAHVFIASARSLGAPARFISGYLWTPDAGADAQAAHSWAEAHVPGFGWIGFDPQNNLCPTASYVRIAVGLDELGAAPVRGAHRGGGEHAPEVRLRIEAQDQSQS
ncbi:transglutaminase [Alsobacter metallidurans]|uniref:Transglutaminase n=1 Tax=Alsobacter metallidurans TaxID=340221 RepID=A0A917I8E6_9HYPH|nr:transglutaminase family protein [Alsobacter metallidurans]GGH25954.1 transglutaminase [Alsobacter metallidurans]